MKKFFKWLGIVIVVLVVILAVGKNPIIKKAAVGAIRKSIGMEISIESLDFGIFDSKIAIEGLRIENPPGFGGGEFIDVPEISVDYVLKSFFSGRADFTEVRLNVKELNVVEDKEGKLNVEVWGGERKESGRGRRGKGGGGDESEEKEPFRFRVDLLKLKIDRATYTRLASGKTEEYDLGIDEEFKNVTGMEDIIRVVTVTALQNNLFRKATGVNIKGLDKLIGVQDPESFEEGIGDLLDSFREASEKRKERKRRRGEEE